MKEQKDSVLEAVVSPHSQIHTHALGKVVCAFLRPWLAMAVVVPPLRNICFGGGEI